jgi:Ca-activated chloride channel family protein
MAVRTSAVSHRPIVLGPGLSPLEGARIDVAIDDLLAEFTLTQQFRNTTPRDIEAVFTFPVPMDAVFLGLSARLGERELEGRVIERQKAARKYEEAIAAGDSAVLVERTQDGMLTANIGNLKAGETISVRLRFAQWLSFNGDLVRFRMPTTIAPRYGIPRMVERDQPVTDLLAQYRFAAEIRVSGLLARAELSSPTHLVTVRRDGDSVVLALKSAWLDRDFALDAHLNDADRCSAMAAADVEGELVTVAVAADLAGRQAALDVSLVVDCSGSMGGVGIHQARIALKEIIRSLSPEDQINLVRFGSSHEKCFPKPAPMEVDLRSRLEEHVAALEANMGGTELIPALEAAAEDLAKTDPRKERGRVIFLITDGEVTETRLDQLKQLCTRAGIRIFCVGVGGSVAEDTLRALSDATSGAVEIVYQNEHMADRIVSHFRRVRAPMARITDVVWPSVPSWSHLPKTFYAGDTIRCFARFDHRVSGEVVVQWQAAQRGEVRLPIRRTQTDDEMSTPARMAAHQQLAATRQRKAKVDLAVRYQLMSDVSSAVLVAKRDEGDKAGDMPETVRVRQQMAAGWGGLDDDGICDFKAEQCSDILFSLPESSRPAPAPATLHADSTEHLSEAVRALIAKVDAASPRVPLRDIWDLREVESLLSWMDDEFAHLLETGGDMEAAVTAMILRWRRTESRRSKVLDILFAQIPKDAVRDFIGALLTIKGLPKVRTLMPSLDRVVGRLRQQGIEIMAQPDIVKGVVVMR